MEGNSPSYCKMSTKQRITCHFFSDMFEEGWQLLGAGSPRKTEDTQEDTQNGTHEKVCGVFGERGERMREMSGKRNFWEHTKR